MKFGKWTVLQYKRGDKTALCRCDCGTQAEVRYTSLTNNLSSGCSKQCGLKNLAGMVFGNLTATAEYKSGTKGRLSYLCKCKCGRNCYVSAQKLKYGKITDCGCKNAQDNKFLANRVLDGYKRNAKNRRLEFSLSIEQFLEITKQNCHYCNLQPSNKIDNKWNPVEFVYSGIDRKENSKGYEFSNCLPCCKVCNIAKNDMPYDEFIEWIRRVGKIWSSR